MKSFKELHEEYLEEKEFPKLKQRKDVSSKTESGKDKSTPEKNYRGLSKSTAQKRENHWKKQREKHHSDSSAYTPAPGDKNAKTKPSKYTQAYHKKYGDPSKEKKKVNKVNEEIDSRFDKEISELSKKYDVEKSRLYSEIEKHVTKYRDLPNTDINTLRSSALRKLKELLAKRDVQGNDMNSQMKDRTRASLSGDTKLKPERAEESVLSPIQERVLNEYYENVFEIDVEELYGEYLEETLSEAKDNITTALKNKSEKSGISMSILRAVYNRGVAAWRGSHRPGTTASQWGLARCNSYIAKGKTYYTADADLHGGKKKTSGKKPSSSKPKTSTPKKPPSSKPKTKSSRTPSKPRTSGGKARLHP